MISALVLGANGFMGGHIVKALSAHPEIECRGAGIGPVSDGTRAVLRDWREIDLVASPAADIVALIAGTAEPRPEGAAGGRPNVRPDVVVNCTGAVFGPPSTLVLVNVVTTARLLEALAAVDRPPRLVQLGSAAEYGPGPAGVAVSEETPCRPVNAYGISKLAATQLVAAQLVAGVPGGRFNAVVLRVFNALGPGIPERLLAGAALRRISEALAAGSDRIEMGDLSAVRDFVDTRDVGAAVAAACLAERIEAPVVNLGSGVPTTARELVEALAAAAGFHGRIVETAAASPRSDAVPWQVADVAVAERVLGWRPEHDLASSVAALAGPLRAALG